MAGTVSAVHKKGIMEKKIVFTKPCSDDKLPRVGGNALIGELTRWPEAPDGLPLTLVTSLPTTFLNQNADLNLPDDHYISVFSYYSQSEYFLDSITYHGDQDELDWLRQGYTKVILHGAGSAVSGSITIPAMVIEVDLAGVNSGAPYQGSKIGGAPALLQAEPLALGDERFALQMYGGKFPKPHHGIFGLSDAIGYLFIDKNFTTPVTASDAGTFFVQAT